MKVVVTGFDAFGGADRNPAEEIVNALATDGAAISFVESHCVVLPTVYATAAGRVAALIENFRPELVVSFGLAAASEAVRLERFAVNVADSAEADNTGSVRRGEPVVDDGPAAHMTGLDLASIASRCERELGSRPEISNHAGSFVCNFVYYSVLHALASAGSGGDALFVHVPWSLPAPGGERRAEAGASPHVQWAQAVIRAAVAARRSARA